MTNSTSLVPLMKGEMNYSKEYISSEIYGRFELGETKQQAIYYDDWKLIEIVPSTKELPSSLFYLKNDPKEQNNLYDKQIETREFLQRYIDFGKLTEQ